MRGASRARAVLRRANLGQMVDPLGELGRSRWRARAALALTLALVPSSCRGQQAGSAVHRRDPNTTRYRLLLRENPVDPGEAFRCYGACQPQATPRGYLRCLETCPGFEITPQEYCAPREVPPVAACFTVRKIPAHSEPSAGLIILEIAGSFLFVVAAQSLCASSKSQCAYGYFPPPH